MAKAKERERSSTRIAKAQMALDDAEQEHDGRDVALQAELTEIEKRMDAERLRWDAQRDKLRATLNGAKQDAG